MINTCRSALCYLLLVVLTGCQPQPSPESIATTFWKAAVNNNSLIMKRLCSAATYDDSDDFSRLHTVTAFQLGKIVIDGDSAEIETRLFFDNPEQPIDITTYLVREDNEWKIDYQRSVSFLSMNREMTELIDDIETLAQELAEQVEGSVEEFTEKALPEIRSRINDAEQELGQQLQEIKKKVDEFLDELERSLEESRPAEPPTTTQT